MRLLAITLALGAIACGPAPGQAPKAQAEDPLSDADGETLLSRGRYAFQMGDLVRAEQYLVAAMEKGVDGELVLPVLVEVCVRGSRYDTALYYAKPYLEKDPENWRLRYLIATLYAAVGRDQAAEVELRRVIVEAPESPPTYYTLGTLLWENNRRAESAAFLEGFLKLSPDGPEATEARALLNVFEAEKSSEKPKSEEEEDAPVARESSES